MRRRCLVKRCGLIISPEGRCQQLARARGLMLLEECRRCRILDGVRQEAIRQAAKQSEQVVRERARLHRFDLVPPLTEPHPLANVTLLLVLRNKPPLLSALSR